MIYADQNSASAGKVFKKPQGIIINRLHRGPVKILSLQQLNEVFATPDLLADLEKRQAIAGRQ